MNAVAAAFGRVLAGSGLGVFAGFVAADAAGLLGDACGLSVILDANANCSQVTLSCLLGGVGGGVAGGGLGRGDGPQGALNDPEFQRKMNDYAEKWRRRNLPPEEISPPSGPVKQYVDDLIEDFFDAVGDTVGKDIADHRDAAREAERQREIDRQARQQYPDNE